MVSESIESLCTKARQAIAEGETDQARQFYLQALGVKADSPDVHYGLATVCFLVGDLPNAAYHFKEVTRLDPLRTGAHINLGAVYNRLDQIEEAIQVLRRGIQLDSHRAEGYYNLGLAYRRKKQIDLAIQAYHEAVRLNPRMGDAHLNLGNAYLDKGLFGQAISHYQSALEMRPGWDKAENGLAQAEAGLEVIKRRSETPGPTGAGSQTTPVTPGSAIADPNRLIDPNIQSAVLNSLHRATIDADTQGRNLVQVLEKEVEPGIKELSSCLLYPNSQHDLDDCLQKFDSALQNMKALQRALTLCTDHIRSTGDRLLKS